MQFDPEAARRRFAELGDDELVRIALLQQDDSPEAKSLAEAELARRGVRVDQAMIDQMRAARQEPSDVVAEKADHHAGKRRRPRWSAFWVMLTIGLFGPFLLALIASLLINVGGLGLLILFEDLIAGAYPFVFAGHWTPEFQPIYALASSASLPLTILTWTVVAGLFAAVANELSIRWQVLSALLTLAAVAVIGSAAAAALGFDLLLNAARM